MSFSVSNVRLKNIFVCEIMFSTNRSTSAAIYSFSQYIVSRTAQLSVRRWQSSFKQSFHCYDDRLNESRSNTLLSMSKGKTRLLCIVFAFIVVVLTIYSIRQSVRVWWTSRSSVKVVYESDIVKYANSSRGRQRIPRLIHQTYRTNETPSIWNVSVRSVIEKNADDFKYRLWTDEEINEFVKDREPRFYEETFVKYRYSIQRVDTFRYVLLYHLGGIYIDMDNGCNRPFRELLNTLESLDPDADDLAAFPRQEDFILDSDFLISTPGHPMFARMISHLPLYNHNYLTHFWTVIISTGPIFLSIEERLFSSSDDHVVRLLNSTVYKPMFLFKSQGASWYRNDAALIFRLNELTQSTLIHSKMIVASFTCSMLIFVCWRKGKFVRDLR